MNKILSVAVLGTAFTSVAAAEDHAHHIHHAHHQHEAYSPHQVMGAHTHDQDEWMLSYRYMRMEMKDFKQDDSDISLSDVYSAGYTVAPTKMTTDMHMISAMKGLTEDFTLMAMGSYLKKDMSLRNNGGVTFNTAAEGLGDTKISVIDNLNRYGFNKWSTMLTLSLPTGSTDKEHSTPMGANTRLPYPMQLGSGTYDLTPAVTYQCTCNGIDFGAQAHATFRIGDGNEGYRLGNQFGLKAWVGKYWTEELASGVTLNVLSQSSITGDDDNLNPNMVVTADANNSGFDKASLTLDIAYKPTTLNGIELVSTYEEPIYQNMNGIQMESKRMFTLGLRKTF